uniref:Uncharacterized protein n=1 Tax=Timema monikensis TaxID=170555 RepID=A0A7R9E4T7_9NEOP|nr:unnamed protein product [Timema monikensis]
MIECPQGDKMTEISQRYMLSQTLKERVYYAARDGMAITLFALLSEKKSDVVQELLNQLQEEVNDHQQRRPWIMLQ